MPLEAEALLCSEADVSLCIVPLRTDTQIEGRLGVSSHCLRDLCRRLPFSSLPPPLRGEAQSVFLNPKPKGLALALQRAQEADACRWPECHAPPIAAFGTTCLRAGGPFQRIRPWDHSFGVSAVGVRGLVLTSALGPRGS